MIAEYALSCLKGKGRELYEDNYYFFDNISEDGRDKKLSTVTDKAALIAVFDGVGGMPHGELASEIAAETLKSEIKASFPENCGDLLRISEKINKRLCSVMRDNNIKFGTTATLLLLGEDRYSICNIGDSPAFLLRQGEFSQLSADHTEQKNIECVVQNAHIKSKKTQLTQYLGIDEREMILEPFAADGELQKGDRFLICTDGVTNAVPHELIKEITNGGTVGSIVGKLSNAAIDNGGLDNITVMCAIIRG